MMKDNIKNRSNLVAKITQILFLGLIIIGVILFGSALSRSYEKTNNTYSRFTPVIPSSINTPTPSPVFTNKTTNKEKGNATKVTDASKPPLPILNGGNIFNLINQYRSSKGLPFLSVSSELCAIAEGRADLMMANDMEAFKKSATGSHFGLDSTSYSGQGVGENLAANLARDEDVLRKWQSSPPHNELMLWTSKDGTSITKGCIATRVSEVGSIIVLLVGDK